MSLHDRVMEVMGTDPGREWTCREIADILHPGLAQWEKNGPIKNVNTILHRAVKYGLVRQTGRGSRGHPSTWRLEQE